MINVYEKGDVLHVVEKLLSQSYDDYYNMI